jgi:hypothetical protein
MIKHFWFCYFVIMGQLVGTKSFQNSSGYNLQTLKAFTIQLDHGPNIHKVTKP